MNGFQTIKQPKIFSETTVIGENSTVEKALTTPNFFLNKEETTQLLN